MSKQHEGYYLNLIEGERGLLVQLTEAGREKLAGIDIEHCRDQIVFRELMEGLLDDGNGGWYMLEPEDIGALTGCPIILCSDVDHPDDGSIVPQAPIYWHERYALDSIITELWTKGTCQLDRGSE